MSRDARILERRFPADPRELRSVRDAVRASLLACGTGSACAEDCVMAVDEACQNIIRHGYCGAAGDILLEIERIGDELVVSLTDFAPRVDPERVKPRALDDLRPGGLGTHLMRQVMDRVEFEEPPPGCGNLLRMVKRIG